MEYEEIIKSLNDFGKYQKRLLFLVIAPVIFNAVGAPLSVFIQPEQLHRCKIPGLHNDTYLIQSEHHQQLVNESIPEGVEEVYDKCNVIINGTEERCTEWVYDQSVFTMTVNSQFDLVCSDESLRSHAVLAYLIGLTLAGTTIVPLADVLGRRFALCTAIAIRIISNIAMPFSPTYLFLTVCRFFDGFSGLISYQCSFIIGLELVAKSKRMVIGTVTALVFCLGELILVAVAYLIRNWKWLQLTLAVPMILQILYLWEPIFPESPRWLIARGREDKAWKIIKNIAMVNKVSLPDTLKTKRKQRSDEGILRIIKRLMKSKKMAVRLAIVTANWFTVGFIYFALTLHIGKFGGDLFLNFTIAVIMEAVGYLFLRKKRKKKSFLLDRTGRKKLHLVTMFTAGIACLSSTFSILYGEESIEWITIALSMIGKLGISAAFGEIYIYTGELFPTVVRSAVLSCGSLGARLGSILSPYVYRLASGKIGKAIPPIIYGVLTIVVALASLYLPETTGKKLLEKVSDVEHEDEDQSPEEEHVPMKSENRR